MKKLFLYIIILFLPFVAVLLLVKFEYFTPIPQQGPVVEVWRTEAEVTETLPLADYLWGVLAGEMPASYPEEALKAQVVASYSYLKYRAGADLGHAGEICDDPAHCKAYLSPAEAAAKWGDDWLEASRGKLQAAVETVMGQAVVYQGKPANTVFHAISGGRTESSEDVWGGGLPYLIPVESPWDKEAAGFASEVVFTLAEFREKLGVTDLTLGALTPTESGSVASLVIGDRTFSGRELRALLGLRSTRFTLEIGEEVKIAVCGYGHQVGMSQYGAAALARAGYGYREILAYYYPNTQVENLFA